MCSVKLTLHFFKEYLLIHTLTNQLINFLFFILAANSGKESQTFCPDKCQNPIPETPKEHLRREEQTLKEEDEQKGEKMEVDEKAVAESNELDKNEVSEKMDTSTPDIASPSEEKAIDMETGRLS